MGLSNKQEIASQAGRLSAYQLGQRLIDFAITMALARILAPGDFGVVAAAAIFIQLAQLVVEIGVGATIVQTPHLTDRDLRVAGTLVWTSAAFYFVATQALAGAAGAFMGSPDVELAIRVLAFTFLFQGLSVVSENLLVKRLEAARVARLQLIVRAIVGGGLGVALAALGWGYWALVGPSVVGALLRSVWTYSLVRPPIRPLYDRQTARRLMRKGMGFSASKVINFVALRGDNALVGHLFSTATLGLYSRAYNLMSLPADLYGTIAERLVFPIFAKAQDDRPRLRQQYLNGVELTALIGLPLSVVLFTFGPEWIKTVLGGKWLEAIAPFQVLAVATYFRLGMKISGSVQRARGAIRHMVGTQIIYASLVVAGCLVAYPFGLLAVCAAVSGGVVLAYLAITWSGLALTGVGVREYLRAHLPGALLALCVAAIAAPVALAGRAWGMGPALILLSFIVAAAPLGLVLLFLRPRPLLGEVGGQVAHSIASRFRRPRVS